MTYDVAIVGAGPAGMSAAIKLKRLGFSVAVVDDQPSPGGQIWRGIERNKAGPVTEALGADYEKGRALTAAFRASGAEYFPETQVWQIEEGWTLFLTSKGKARPLTAKTVLLATGAQERPAPFPGWTLPGVLTVGAAQILLKSGGILPEGEVWVVGAGPLPLLYATQFHNLGGRIAGYIDTSHKPTISALKHLPKAWRDFPSLLKGLRWLWSLHRSGKVVRGVGNLRADGEGKLEYLSWRSHGQTHRVKADVVLVHEGVVPRIHETLALGCDHDWNLAQSYFSPRLDRWNETSRQGLFVAGDASGVAGWSAAVASGEIAALGIAVNIDPSIDVEKLRQESHVDLHRQKALALRPFLDELYRPPSTRIADDVIVCRCEEVSAGTIRAVARVSAPDPGAIKAATRCGMGPCQGRQCGYSVQALVAEINNMPCSEINFFNIRPPLKPVTLGEIAGLEEIQSSK